MSDWIYLFLLAVVQGVTEFLPVSSSGHLAVLGALCDFKESDSLSLGIVLHAGSLAAIVVFYFRELWKFVVPGRWRLLGMVLLGSVPAGIGGVTLKVLELDERLFSKESLMMIGFCFLITGALLRGSGVKSVGLCHSVQIVVKSLLATLGLDYSPERLANIHYKTAGINHMAWLLEVKENGKDLYPELKKLAEKKLRQWRKAKTPEGKHSNMVRLDIMRRFGYYITESSVHSAEYLPYWIKRTYPELVPEFNILLDEYPRRCVKQIEEWKKQYQELRKNPNITHERSREYGSGIMEAILTGKPYQIGGNVLNTGLITNLPRQAVVEVPCLVDGSGVQGTYIGDLPTQCAALNVTNINPQLLTIEAALTRKRELIYQAAMLDPRTAAELSLDDIVSMCDDLIEAHGNMLPKYR